MDYVNILIHFFLCDSNHPTMTNENKIWTKCLEKLSESLTDKDMRLWIKPLVAKEGDKEINLYAPNKFMKEEVESQFMSKISEVMGILSNGYAINLGVSSSQVNKKVESRNSSTWI